MTVEITAEWHGSSASGGFDAVEQIDVAAVVVVVTRWALTSCRAYTRCIAGPS
jgi:hypothetical protein